MKATFFFKNYDQVVEIKQERNGNKEELDLWADNMFNSCNTLYGKGRVASWVEIIEIVETRGYRDCM